MLTLGDKVASQVASDGATYILQNLLNQALGGNSKIQIQYHIPQVGPDPYHVGSVVKVMRSTGPVFLSIQLLGGDVNMKRSGKKTNSGREIKEHQCLQDARWNLFGKGYFPEDGHELRHLRIENNEQYIEQFVQESMERLRRWNEFLVKLKRCADHAQYVGEQACCDELRSILDEYSHIVFPSSTSVVQNLLEHVKSGSLAGGGNGNVLLKAFEELSQDKDMRDIEKKLPPELNLNEFPVAGEYHAFWNNCQHDLPRVIQHLKGKWKDAQQ